MINQIQRTSGETSIRSFSLKYLEKLVEHHIDEKALSSHLLNKNEYDYQRRKTFESVFQSLVLRIEDVTLKGDYAMGVFADIEVAFPKTP